MKSTQSGLTVYDSLQSEVAVNDNPKNGISIAKPKDYVVKGERMIAVYDFPTVQRHRNGSDFGRSVSCQFLSKALLELCQDPCEGHSNLTKNSPENQVLYRPAVQRVSFTRRANSSGGRPQTERFSPPHGATAASKSTERSPSHCSQASDQDGSDYGNGKYAAAGTCNGESCKMNSRWVLPNQSTSARLRSRSEHSEYDRESSRMSNFDNFQADNYGKGGHRENNLLTLQNPKISSDIKNHEDGKSNKCGLVTWKMENTTNNSMGDERHAKMVPHEFSDLSLRELRKIFENVDSIKENALKKNSQCNSNHEIHEDNIVSPVFSFEKHDRFVDVYRFADMVVGATSDKENTLSQKRRPKKAGLLIHLLCFCGLILYAFAVLFLLLYMLEQRRQFWETIHASGYEGYEGEDESKAVILHNTRLVSWWPT